MTVIVDKEFDYIDKILSLHYGEKWLQAIKAINYTELVGLDKKELIIKFDSFIATKD